MQYEDLRDFLDHLERQEQLKRVHVEVDPYLEITEIADRVLKKQGAALLFESPKNSAFPLLANLFGTTSRVANAMGCESLSEIREMGKFLAFLKEPSPPKGFKDLLKQLPLYKQLLNMAPEKVKRAPCQAIQWKGKDIDLGKFPIQTCWPGDVAPLITWGLVVTQGISSRQNIGIYRQQVIAPNKVIMRWLAHRGGALDYAKWWRSGSRSSPC